MTEKRFEERELNAIVDLIVSQRCDRTIIGFYESSFAYFAMIRVAKTLKTQKIYFFCDVNDETVNMITN